MQLGVKPAVKRQRTEGKETKTKPQALPTHWEPGVMFLNYPNGKRLEIQIFSEAQLRQHTGGRNCFTPDPAKSRP